MDSAARHFACILVLFIAVPAAGKDDSPVLTSEITRAELEVHVRTLASDEFQGRRAGTDGAEAAAAYIARQFEAAGLEPAGDEGTWLQWFTLPMKTAVPEKSGLTARSASGEPRAFALGPDWKPFSFSAEAQLEDAEVVFVGYGISAPDQGYDDYAGIDVKGRAVVVLRRAPGGAAPKFGRVHQSFEQKAQVAAKKGAAAVIQVDDRFHVPRQADRVPTRVQVRGKPPGVPYVFAKRAVLDHLFSTAGGELTPTDLERKIDESGKPQSRVLDGVRVSLSLVLRSPRTANVVGRLPGADPKLAAEVVVVGAHYDHLGTDGMGALDPQSKEDRIWNGADDNASGTAGLIEIAERLAMAEQRPPRTLIFVAFTAEELGLYGSGHYVRKPAVPLESTVAMVNLDMIGRSRDGFLMVGGTGTAKPFDALLTEMAEGAGLNIRRRPDGGSPSDNLHFHRRKVPTLFFFTGLHKDYHRVTDHWDRIEYPTAAKVADLAAGMVDAIARLPEKPGFVTVPQSRRSVGPRLGIYPDATHEGPGVRIQSVMQASAAAKGGLIDGDIITAFGGAPVKTANDLSAALRKVRAGSEVEVVVVREGERLKLKVTF